MIITKIAVGSVLLVLSTVPFAATADRGANSFEVCSGLQLSLEGADHYYWVAPEKGWVVMVRACGPVEADCDHDVITVWDGDGRKIFEAAPSLDVPGMPPGPIRDAALRTPDRLVVSVAVGNTDDSRPVLAEYDVASGDLLRVVPTGSVQCLDLVGNGGGITWCLGQDTARRGAGEDHDLVYRFDEVGALQSSTLPRSAFSPQAHPLADTWRGNFRGGFLRGQGRLRLWLPEVGELISFDEAGRVSDRLVLPTVSGQQREHLVSAADGAVYAMIVTGEENEPREWTQALYRLADDGSAWAPLEQAPIQVPMRIALVGADDTGLIFLDRKTLVLCRLPVAGEAGQED